MTIRRACENITAVRRSRWRYWTGSLLALVSVGASSSWAAATPSGTAGPRFTVAPKAVIPATKYYDGINHAFLGTGAMVTLRVGPNKILRPWFPVRVQECEPHPTAANDCDPTTTLTYDPVTRKPVRRRQRERHGPFPTLGATS